MSESITIDYFSGKWYLDTEKYVFDITNGHDNVDGVLFGNMTVCYDFRNDGVLQITYQGNLPQGIIFPKALLNGVKDWKYDGIGLYISSEQFEFTVVNSDQFLLASNDTYPQMLFSRVDTISDTIEFGRFEQDAIVENGKEIIEWLVIKETEDYKVLLSKYALEVLPIDEKQTIENFGDSLLYTWLNTVFFESFNENERKSMLKTGLG